MERSKKQLEILTGEKYFLAISSHKTRLNLLKTLDIKPRDNEEQTNADLKIVHRIAY